MASRRKNAHRNDTTLDPELMEEELGDEIPEIDNLALGPVENAEEVPLFANKYADAKRAIHVLKIVKLDQPGAGYKGEIPKNSTLETISQMFGDGLYNIEAINAGYKVLRVMQNVRIALGTGNGVAATGLKAPPLGTVPVSNKEDLDRIERLATATGAQAAQQARDYTTLVTTTVTSAAERERTFMQGVQENSQTFFSNLLTLQTQGFQQVLALMQAGHQQTMEAMRASTTQNNPNDMIRLLISGIQMGRDLDEPPEQPFWQELLQGGVQLLTGANASVPKVALPPPMDVPSISAGNGKKASKAPTSKEAKQLLRLYKALRTRGIDIEAITSQLEAGNGSANKAHSERPSEEPTEDEESDTESEDDEDVDTDVEDLDDESEGFEGTGDTDSPANPE